MIQLECNQLNKVYIPTLFDAVDDEDFEYITGRAGIVLKKIVNYREPIVITDKDIDLDIRCNDRIDNVQFILDDLPKGEYTFKFLVIPGFKYTTIANIK
jgi:hypothetical protein